jgi:hypothetical protein
LPSRLISFVRKLEKRIENKKERKRKETNRKEKKRKEKKRKGTFGPPCL